MIATKWSYMWGVNTSMLLSCDPLHPIYPIRTITNNINKVFLTVLVVHWSRYNTDRTVGVVHYIITNTSKDCTSRCAKSTGASHNQVHIFIFGLTANHITCGFANYQDHLIVNLFEWWITVRVITRKWNFRCRVLMVNYCAGLLIKGSAVKRGQGHGVVFLGKTLYLHSAFVYPKSETGHWWIVSPTP